MLEVDLDTGITIYSTTGSEHFDEYFQWFHGTRIIKVWNDTLDVLMDEIELTLPPTLEQLKTACIAYSEEHYDPYVG